MNSRISSRFRPAPALSSICASTTTKNKQRSQYEFKDLKQIPAGTRIEFDMRFDNNEEQAAIAGINPNRAVKFGGPTTDEMDLGWYTFATAKPSETDATEE